MPYTTSPPQQLGPAASLPSGNKAALTQPTPSSTVPAKPAEPAKVKLPYAMERYLEEAPRDGGGTYALVHESRHQEILGILAVVDFEFGERKIPSWLCI